MDLILPKPHEGQKQVLNCSKRFIVLQCGRRWGKSLIAQIISIFYLLKGKRVAYITPTYQLATNFFDVLVKLLPKIVKTNRSELSIVYGSGLMKFFTAEKLDNLRGYKFHVVIIDEAAMIRNLKDGWEQAVRPTLTDYKGRAYFISTPRGFDYFQSLVQKKDDNWATFHFNTYENPYIPKEEIEEAKRSLPNAVFEQEYMANPMQNADNPFGSDNIRKCITELSDKPVLYWGIDLAKSVDYTVIIGLDENGKVAQFERFQQSWGMTKQRIINVCNIGGNGLIDQTGVGDPIVEELEIENPNLRGFKFTAQSKQDLIKGLMSSIAQQKIKFPKGEITNELETFEYRYTPNGTKYAARDGFHDDCVMALALANYEMINYRPSNIVIA